MLCECKSGEWFSCVVASATVATISVVIHFFSSVHSSLLVWCALKIKFKELTMRFAQGSDCIRQCSESRTVEKLSISIAKG